MSNGARHGLGVLVGLVASVVLPAWFLLLANRFFHWRMAMSQYITQGTGGKGVVLVLLLLVSGVLIAALCAPRLSPLASLIPGVVLVVVNTLWLVQPLFVRDHIARPLEDRWVMDYLDMLSSGIVLLAGAVLIAMSVPPSRWRGRTRPVFAGAPEAFSGIAGPGMPGPVPHGHPGPGMGGHGMPGSGMAGPGAAGPGASPGPFGQPPAYPPAPQAPGTPPAAPPPA
ncbi:hypothetical protein AB0L06_03785 [Spirillospora sp. NPDC052269]